MILNKKLIRLGYSALIVLITLLIIGTAPDFITGADSSRFNNIHSVEVQDFKFRPQQLTVNKGDTITWINKDLVPHNAFYEKGDLIFDTGQLLQDSISMSIIIKENGTFEYYCKYHPTMKGVITTY